MGIRRPGWLGAALLAAALVPAAAGAAPGAEIPLGDGALPDGLGALLAERASVYASRTLGFQCLERAHEEALDDDGTARSEKIRERRYLLELGDGGEVYRALRGKPDGGRLSGESPFPFPEPFAWTQLFDETLRSGIRFRVGASAVVADRPALPIRFDSSDAVEDGLAIREWSGTAWVDPESGDLLRIVAEPNFQEEALAEANAAWLRKTGIRVGTLVFKPGPRPRGRRLEVEFGERHEGLLYPSRATLLLVRVSDGGDLVPDARTLVEYRDYRFFRTASEARER